MTQDLSSLKTDYRQAIKALPWQTHRITLLLDGINTPDLLPMIYAEQVVKEFEILYVQTRFTELRDVSPCLIALNSPNDYPLDKFLDNLHAEWGYCLVSRASWAEQVRHLRNLLVIKGSELDRQMLLKIADPQVITALLNNAIQCRNPTLFGPFERVLTYDVIDERIYDLRRPEGTIYPIISPYQLTPQESDALDWVDVKRANQQIYAHIVNYFPNFPADGGNQRRAIDWLIGQAEQKGYTSLQEQLYYLNIHGYLGVNALEQYPQLGDLISKKDIESLKEAAHLAEKLADKGMTL